jgi:hypothetical protein
VQISGEIGVVRILMPQVRHGIFVKELPAIIHGLEASSNGNGGVSNGVGIYRHSIVETQQLACRHFCFYRRLSNDRRPEVSRII